jgi:hypothetical protein
MTADLRNRRELRVSSLECRLRTPKPAARGKVVSYGANGSALTTSLGLEASTLVKFCGAQLCWIRVSGTPKDSAASAWTKSFVGLAGALEGKYGKPTKREVRIPRICNGDLGPCLKDGTAHAELLWKHGRRVTVSIRTPSAILREIASCDAHDAGTSQEKGRRSERARSAIRREVSNGGARALRFGSLGESARG